MKPRALITAALVVVLTLAAVIAIGALPHDVQPMPRILVLAGGITALILALRPARRTGS
ncbi:hypothetical protein [Streptomyces sp. NBC_00091]|uniref:hypothetical protein n=1 Tax=Streptomyces sp. NBC_00091 TaxID=2975648 RepID=UPI00224FE880|nr:hypothetical protein [Streptomyces sp. NBC_00091]MCX5377358.1 hypothetical protein [Streptomyces sp. NBC_00091]